MYNVHVTSINFLNTQFDGTKNNILAYDAFIKIIQALHNLRVALKISIFLFNQKNNRIKKLDPFYTRELTEYLSDPQH